MNWLQRARFSGSPAWSLAVSAWAAALTAASPCLDSILGQTIEPRQLTDGISRVARLVAGVFPSPEDHAKLRAPVAQVVVADHAMSECGS